MNDNGYVETDPTGRYGRFGEVLGKGAMKTVYRAFDELNGIEVAWNQAKLCNVLRSPDALERMYSEVHLLSTLRHYSIIRFHGSWIDVGKRTFNFITEMFTSGTLREYRQRYRRVDTRAIRNWARQILHGLVYLHGHDPPVIHRDIKCDNIFINGHLGQLKIGDLGLAAILQGSQAAHSVIGTPEFMAPELYEEEYNELVDIYSFGMCVLEMLTSEYPYSECMNPAQIYKKVTSGKLPHAFYRIQDPEARRFISRCLETVSKRSSAKELLLDPFLLSGDLPHPLPTSTAPILQNNGTVSERHDQMSVSEAQHHQLTSPTDMTITGKMNPEDDTIFLKVQIADKDGNVRNVYFPFDIVSDTPIDVANEMVKELEITDREPSEIAEIIAQEISILVPYWKEDEPHEDQHHAYSYSDEIGNPFYYLSSPTSSQGSVPGPSRRHGKLYHADWIRDDLFRDDDDDTSSTHSGKYSAWNYYSGNEQDANYSSPHLSETQSFPKTQKPTRLCPEEESYLATKFHGQCNVLPEPSHGSLSRRGKKPVDGGQLMRNRSMVDVRSQLLHRTLVEELSKRLFKTVGAVENVGFNMVCRGSSASSQGDAKKQGHGGGTG